MKRKLLLILLIVLTAGFLSAQSAVDLQLAITTQALTKPLLEELGLSGEQIDNILEYQNEYLLQKEAAAIDLNVIKAQLAQLLYKADSDQEEIDKLLEQAGQLRLEQEKAQVRTYNRIRQEMGEKKWSELMLQVRNRYRNREEIRTDSRAGKPERTPQPPPAPSAPPVPGMSPKGTHGR